MKIRSLLLGSIAAVGLASGAQAADLGVLTSLDVCDALGISGLTISSDTNCLQISGSVSYTFQWGDYRGRGGNLMIAGRVPAGEQATYVGGAIDLITAGNNGVSADQEMDWQSNVTALITAVATADSDFGPAKAVITLKQESVPRFRNEAYVDNDGDNGGAIEFEEAYVAVGDSTVIMAGRRADATKGSVANFGDDAAFNFLGSFAANKVDGGGVLMESDDNRFGHDSIQIVSDLGNGFSVAAGLENITGPLGESLIGTVGGTSIDAGTLLGVVQYAGEGITAHVTAGGFGVLDGDINEWFIHAGATGTFDAFKIRAAAAYSDRQGSAVLGAAPAVADANAFHGLISGSATFDMFTLALTGEYARQETAGLVNDGFGIGGSIGAKVTDGVAINLGARYFNGDYQYGNAPNGTNALGVAGAGVQAEDELLQVAIQVVASLSETITVTGEIGGYWNDKRNSFDAAAQENVFDDGLYYGALKAEWAPGGGFKTSLQGEANTQGAYRLTYSASKSFE